MYEKSYNKKKYYLRGFTFNNDQVKVFVVHSLTK